MHSSEIHNARICLMFSSPDWAHYTECSNIAEVFPWWGSAGSQSILEPFLRPFRFWRNSLRSSYYIIVFGFWIQQVLHSKWVVGTWCKRLKTQCSYELLLDLSIWLLLLKHWVSREDDQQWVSSGSAKYLLAAQSRNSPRAARSSEQVKMNRQATQCVEPTTNKLSET